MNLPTASPSHLSRFVTHVVIIAAAVLGSASTLFAQDRMFVLLPHYLGLERLLEVDTAPERFGQIRKSFPVPSTDSPTDPVSIGGGRYLVWLTGMKDVLNIFDTQAERLFTLPGLLPTASSILAVDTMHARLFVRGPNSVIILDGQQGVVREVPAPNPNPWSTGSHAAYAPSTDRLFFVSEVAPTAQDPAKIDVIDVAAGVVERTLTLPGVRIADLAVDGHGTRLFVATPPTSFGGDTAGVYIYDPESGALLVHHVNVHADTSERQNLFQLDESRRRMTMISRSTERGVGVAAFDLDTLALIGIVEGQDRAWASNSSFTPFHALTGPRSPLYVFNSLVESRDDCASARLERLDPNSGALLQRVEVSRTWGALLGRPTCIAYPTLLSPPPAPTLQSAGVNGGTVTLTWTPSTDALHYDIDAGSAPGLSNLAVSHGHTGTTFSVNGIPSGRYFVRLRAINWVGRSLPSNEVEVVVP